MRVLGRFLVFPQNFVRKYLTVKEKTATIKLMNSQGALVAIVVSIPIVLTIAIWLLGRYYSRRKK